MAEGWRLRRAVSAATMGQMAKAQLRKLLENVPFTLALAGLALSALGLFTFLMRDSQAPRVALETSAQTRTSTDRQVDRLQQRVREAPADHDAYVQLASAYLQKARETGGVAYYNRAEQVTARALELKPASAAALTTMGAVALARHEFPQALEWARRALEADPRNPHAYGVLGDAQVEMGQYEDAFQSYEVMVNLKPSLDSYARVSYARELTGDVEGAIEAMQMAIAAGPAQGESAAWAQVQLGELYFNTGHIDQAASHFQAALSAFPNYYLALSALAKARAAQGNLPDAIALYQRSTAILPQPSALAALADIFSRLGRSQEAQTLYDTISLIASLQSLNQQLYNRELVLFYADHDLKLPQALALAQQELAVRRDIFGYDALAWALYKNGRHAEAGQAMEQALSLGTQHASLFYHAGMVYYALGEREQARVYLERALGLNPHFSFLLADSARLTLKELR